MMKASFPVALVVLASIVLSGALGPLLIRLNGELPSCAASRGDCPPLDPFSEFSFQAGFFQGYSTATMAMVVFGILAAWAVLILFRSEPSLGTRASVLVRYAREKPRLVPQFGLSHWLALREARDPSASF